MQLILSFQLKLLTPRGGAASQDQHTVFMKTSHVPLPYPPCVVPLSSLKKIMINDLLLETQHRGSYLLVRSVTPEDRMTAVVAIVEDEKGDVLMINLYHQGEQGEQRETEGDELEAVLSEGMVMILKEPYLKAMAGGSFGLRVDHLSDVVFLSADDDRIPSRWQAEAPKKTGSALGWKTKGNGFFNKLAYRSAIEWYVRANLP